MNIDKKIYYCWVGGGKKPDIFYKCKKSWEENMPDYEIIEINENNFDMKHHLEKNKFFRECYIRNMWAYVSDYIRVHYMYENSGIYVDTDMEIIKDITPLLENKNNILNKFQKLDKEKKYKKELKITFLTCYEDEKFASVGIFATEKYSPILKDIIDFYEKGIWKKSLWTIPKIMTYIFEKKYGLTNKRENILIYDNNKSISILPQKYFYPFKYNEKFTTDCITQETHGIHWFHGSWLNNPEITIFLETKHLRGIRKIIKKKKLISKLNELEKIKKMDTIIFKLEEKEQIKYINDEYLPKLNINFKINENMKAKDVYYLYKDIKKNVYKMSKLDKDITLEILLRCLFSIRNDKKNFKYYFKLLFDKDIFIERRLNYIKRFLSDKKYNKYLIYHF